MNRTFVAILAAIALLFVGAAIGWTVRGEEQAPQQTTVTETVEQEAETVTETEAEPEVEEEVEVPTEVTRELLATTDSPDGLQDLEPPRTLSMARITIPPGVTLPWHYHDGTQIAQVVEGTLTYEVREGEVEVWKGTSEDDASVDRTIAEGETAEISSGEWLVEQPSSVHRGSNETDQPVVILVSTLLLTGASPSTPVD